MKKPWKVQEKVAPEAYNTPESAGIGHVDRAYMKEVTKSKQDIANIIRG